MGLIDTLLRRPNPEEIGIQAAIPVAEIPSPEPAEPSYPDTIKGIRKRILEQICLSDIPQIRQELLRAYPAILAYYQKIYGEFTKWAEQAHQPFIGKINGHRDGDDSDGSWRSQEWLDVEDNQLYYHRTHQSSMGFIGNFQNALEITGGRRGENVTLVRFQSSESRVIAEDGSLIPSYRECFNPTCQFGENNTFELKFAPDGTPLELEITSASGFRKEFPDTNLEFKLKFSNPEESA